MAMDPGGLSAKLQAEIRARFDIFSGFGDDVLQKFCDACGHAVVEYIQDKADVVATAHLGEDLSSPTGQPVDITTGPGTGSTGATSADAEIVGKGSIE